MARAVGELARLHGPARDEDGGHVDPQRPHEHARHDLVAVGDADHGVERWAFIIVSTESAMSSREGRL